MTRRVSVFRIAEVHVVGGDAPEEIAHQLSLSLAEVHTALADDADHPEEIAETRKRRDRVIATLAARSAAPTDFARQMATLAVLATGHVNRSSVPAIRSSGYRGT